MRKLQGKAMFDWIMRTRTGAWAVAFLAAAGLIAIGFGLAGDYYRSELQRWQERATQAEIRANRLATETKDRLPLKPDIPPGQDRAGSLLPQMVVSELRLGQPSSLLQGRVVLTLERLNPSAQRARVRVKVDEKEGVAIVSPDSKVSFRVDGILYQLVLQQTKASAATVALVPQ